MKRRLEQSPEDLTRVESNLASLLTFRGELDEAEERYRHILSVRFATSPDDPDIARTLRALGNVLYLNGDLPEAEIVVREAQVLLERTQPRPTTLTASVLSTLGSVACATSSGGGERCFRRDPGDSRRAAGTGSLARGLDLERSVRGVHRPRGCGVRAFSMVSSAPHPRNAIAGWKLATRRR